MDKLPQEYFFSASDGVGLFAREWFPEEPSQVRATVVLVHGIGEHSGRYSHVAEFLSQRSISVLGFDLRGHGRSQGLRGDTPSYDQFLNDIGQRIRSARDVFPGRKIFLLGHSLGGNLVINYVLRRMSSSSMTDPVDGVIVSGPALQLAMEPPAWKTALAQILIHLAPGFSIASGLEANAISRDPAVVHAYLADPLVHDRITPRLYLGFSHAGILALEHAGDWPVVREHPLPGLLTYGTADRLVSILAIQNFARKVNLPSVSLVPWQGLFHEIHNEPEQKAVLAAYGDWIEAHLG
jgi:alpha-beta hydrolase superfamily lysophospholipase